ncbi:hypothetical protein BGZ74_011818 [Mortierella antarctica]|nr:hypothetical protein BGZ74_011818 [Mortierella antarctica]
MADTFPQDATPHPRQGDHSPSARSTSRPHSRQGATPEPKKSTSGPRPFIFHTRHDSTASEDADSGNSDDSNDTDDGDVDSQHHHRKGRRSRRRRLSASASHLLAQAPSVPDLRFDHNYRKALDQIYEAHAADLAKAEAARAQASSTSSSPGAESQDKKKKKSSSSSPQQQQEKEVTVHSIRTRIAVMTLRDIIIMPFVHGFFWGFGTILLTLASQRSLAYHLTRSFNRVFGREGAEGGAGQQQPVFRGEPARIRRAGNATGLGGVGLSGGRPGFAY